MSEPSFPARLHVLIPANSDTAVVIRRGPSKHTCVLSWNMQTDEVKLGQWLKGRIYERRSDISPDGKYWIYFAMNGHWGSESKGSWTAIARAPYLKAIAFFPKGDCWHGGGLFTGNRKYWLNGCYFHEPSITTKDLKPDEKFRSLGNYGGECPSVYYNRLQRDGWTLADREENGRYDARVFFEKELPHGWVLKKICHEQIGAPKGKGCYWDEHMLLSKAGVEFDFPVWEWAEWAGDDIAFAREGCLFRIGIRNAEELSAESLIHDFNGHNFEQIEAPY